MKKIEVDDVVGIFAFFFALGWATFSFYVSSDLGLEYLNSNLEICLLAERIPLMIVVDLVFLSFTLWLVKHLKGQVSGQLTAFICAVLALTLCGAAYAIHLTYLDNVMHMRGMRIISEFIRNADTDAAKVLIAEFKEALTNRYKNPFVVAPTRMDAAKMFEMLNFFTAVWFMVASILPYVKNYERRKNPSAPAAGTK